MENIILVGYGGHAKSVVDILESTKKYNIIGYTDIKEAMDARHKYWGTDDELTDVYENGTNHAVICIGYMGHGNLRDHMYKKLKNIGFNLPTIIDSTAIVSKSTTILEGTVIGKGVIINAEAMIGKMCIINSGAIVEHEDRIGDYCHIGVGATLCGNVKIADHCFIGANSTVIQGIDIGARAIVAAGATVIKEINSGKVYYGLKNEK